MVSNYTAAKNRVELDVIGWETLDAHIPPTRPEDYRSDRPQNFEELWAAVQAFVPHPEESDPLPWTWPAFEHAWSNFLHEFFYWRTEDFFALSPAPGFGLEYGALLAGTAEFLCHRYDLEVPDWVGLPQYRLPQLWDPAGEFFPHMRDTLYLRVQRSEPEFLSRNVVFEARNLITL